MQDDLIAVLNGQKGTVGGRLLSNEAAPGHACCEELEIIKKDALDTAA